MADMREDAADQRDFAGRNGGDGTEPSPLVNRYARDKRVQFNHRLYETFARTFHELSCELIEEGYPPAQVSQAELLAAVLHFGMPATADEAKTLIQRWGQVKAAPPAP